MQAGYLQFDPVYLQVETNLDRVETLLTGIDADLLVLPELFTSGYFFQSQTDLEQVAEPVPGGPTTERLRTWARDSHTTFVAGLPEQGEKGIYNSAVLVRPDGTTEVYRKIHLFYEETELFTPGDRGFQVFDVTTREGRAYRLGLMVCFDWYFPEAARSLAVQGADVIAHPSNLVLPHCPDSMPVRARENHVYTITANRYGTEKKEGEELTFIGLSEVCNPSGEIMKRAERSGDALDLVSFDPTDARERSINALNDVLEDRRPETYVMA